MTETAKKPPGRPRKPDAQRTGNFSVRMPEELREGLESAASVSGRSVNAEIVKRLEDSFGAVSDVKLLERRLEEIEEIDELLVHINCDLQSAEKQLLARNSAEYAQAVKSRRISPSGAVEHSDALKWLLESRGNKVKALQTSRKRVLEDVLYLIGQIQQRAAALADR